jgi:hypothetical protein
VHLVTEGDAARDGVGLGGVEPIHHIRNWRPIDVTASGSCASASLPYVALSMQPLPTVRCSVNTDHRTCEHEGSDANDGQEVFDASEIVDVSRVTGDVGG